MIQTIKFLTLALFIAIVSCASQSPGYVSVSAGGKTAETTDATKLTISNSSGIYFIQLMWHDNIQQPYYFGIGKSGSVTKQVYSGSGPVYFRIFFDTRYYKTEESITVWANDVKTFIFSTNTKYVECTSTDYNKTNLVSMAR